MKQIQPQQQPRIAAANKPWTMGCFVVGAGFIAERTNDHEGGLA